MTAEAIANVMADLLAGRIADVPHDPGLDGDLNGHARGLVHSPTVIDATHVYHALLDRDEVRLYEDHPCIAPPFEEFVVAYVNEHGNVVATHLSITTDARTPDERDEVAQWATENEVDWQRVRWTVCGFVYVGGRGGEGPAPTRGPAHGWAFAIYEDGEPADLHWMQVVPENVYARSNWDMAHLVVLGAMNFLNCRNVDIVEPSRPRAEARRIARTGVRVHTINVFPTGRATRSDDGAPLGGGVPLSSVRGHFATYGPEYGRGLLFGKYAGRFWIPQHARGSAEHGRSEADYRLVPDGPEEFSG